MKYRKKPVVIEAIINRGNNTREIFEFVGASCFIAEGNVIIKTLEGDHTAQIGDYIIKGVKGEFYPCKPDIFEMTYERIGED